MNGSSVGLQRSERAKHSFFEYFTKFKETRELLIE